MRVIVGSYTHGGPVFEHATGEGLALMEMDPGSAALKLLDLYKGIVNPAYGIDGGEGRVYVVAEHLVDEGRFFAFDVRDDKLTLLWEKPSGGRGSNHLALSVDGASLLSPAYWDALIKGVSLSSDDAFLTRYEGTGPNAERQESSHPHQLQYSPGGGWLLIPDLGADKIWLHMSGEEGRSPSKSIDLPAGSGPRHCVFHQDGLFLYLVCELDGSLHTGNWNEAKGECEWVNRLCILPEGFDGGAASSAIRVHPKWARLYVGDRGSNTIAIYDIAEGGNPKLIDHLQIEGRTPRDFVISPNGEQLLIACQDSDTLETYRLSMGSGLPDGSPPNVTAFKTPAFVAFLA